MNQPRFVNQSSFTTHDNVNLFYRHWPAVEKRRGCIVMFHRGHEHSERNAHLVEELNLPDFDFFAWDARGHGLSPGERGDSPSFSTSVRDVNTFINYLSEQYQIPIENIIVLGQSVGAVLTSAWVHDYAPNIRGMIIASPAFRIKLYVPFARLGLTLMHAILGNFFITSYVKSSVLTHDIERQKSYDNDPLIARSISVRMLLGLYQTSKRIVNDAHAITVPTQLLISGSDWVVHVSDQFKFFRNLGSKVKEQHLLENFYQDTLGEKDRQIAIEKIRPFITQLFSNELSPVSLLEADKYGVTYEESQKIAKPLSPKSPQGMYWNVTRWFLKLGASFSKGLRLGRDTGFDSGATLDYIYQNKPTGSGILGRFIDKQYLQAIGWRGIRQRKIHLEELLEHAISLLKNKQSPVNIIDIAAGLGRYTLDVVNKNSLNDFQNKQSENSQAKNNSSENNKSENIPSDNNKATSQHYVDSILLRDYDEQNIQQGQRLIQHYQLQNIARFEYGDAFNTESIADVQPRPTLGIVSGLYELFPDNKQVQASLVGLAKAIPTGGYLIYTGQPWHPQLEFIGRALTSHRGYAWVMRRRSQLEMDQLVEAAGFKKIEQRIDEWGVFTVSIAVRK